MIRQDTFLQGYALAKDLESIGLKVEYSSNTLIGKLTEAALCEVALTESDNKDITDIEFVALNVEYYSSSGNLDSLPTRHDEYMNESVALLAGTISNILGYTRNVVKPMISHSQELLDRIITEYQPEKASELFDIRIGRIPGLLTQTGLLTLANLEGNTPNFPNRSFRIPNLLKDYQDSIYDRFLVGDSNTDLYIKQWIANVGANGDNYLNDLWPNLFYDQYEVPSLSLEEMDSYTILDLGILGIITSNYFLNKPDEEAGVGIREYERYFNQLSLYCQTLIANALVSIQKQIKAGILVTKINPFARYLVVHAELYEQWIQSGGRPEVLLGLLVSEDTLYRTEAINANTERLMDRWNHFQAVYDNSEIIRCLESIKNSITLHYGAFMDHISEEEQSQISGISNFTTVSKQKFDSVVNQIQLSDLEDTLSLAIRLTCRSRFFYTDAEKILTHMEAQLRYQPNLQPREASLIAEIACVSQYLASQLQISQI